MKLLPSVDNDLRKVLVSGRKYLLAFSGGPDSVYLLLSLSLFYKAELKDHIALCYINYHDSPYVDKEEEIVRHYSSLFSLDLFYRSTHFGKGKDHNFEDWARDYRYSFFASVVRKNGFAGLLTAHQKTDKAETYLLQKKRNNLPLHYGLVEENRLGSLLVLRPLLSVSKKELENSLLAENILFYDDITNRNLKKERNRLRKNLTEEEIGSLSKEIDLENRKLAALYERFASYPFGMSFPSYLSFQEEEKKRYGFFLLDQQAIQKNRSGLGKRIYDFLKRQESGFLPLSGNLILVKNRKGFLVLPDTRKMEFSCTVKKRRILKTPFFTMDLKDYSLFNLKKLPVTVRNARKGDKLSTNLPTKDVYKALKKQSVPFYLIPIYPVFVQNGKIVSLPFYKDILLGRIPFSFSSRFRIIEK